jgi:uncharacterized protein (DUF427 family)
MFQAKLGDLVIAQADEADVVHIEGNVYFPPSSVTDGVLRESPTPYTCPWKGACQYFSVRSGDDWVLDGAWSYPEPYPTATERVGREFAGYLAFGQGVRVTQSGAA